jgi:hypothetical protein
MPEIALSDKVKRDYNGGYMPNRIIKESICSSDTVDKLSWFEECFFYRLMVNCDDYGRMDARSAILKSRLFPLKNVTDKQMEAALNTLRTAGIVEVYMYDDRPFLQLRTWDKHQQIRAKKSKYPSMDESEIICNQVISNVPEIQSNPNPNPNPNLIEGRGFSPILKSKLTEWLKYKNERRENYKETGLTAFLSEVENKLKKYNEADIMAVISSSMASNYRGIVWDKLKGKEKAPEGKSYTENI